MGDFRGSGTRNPFLHPQGQQQPQDAGGQLERQENGQGFGDGAPGQLEQPQGPHHADGQHQGLAQRCPQEQGRSLGPGAGEFHVHTIAQGDHRHHRPQDMALEKGDHRQGHADGPGQDPGGVPAGQYQGGVHQGTDEQGHDGHRQGQHQPQLLAERPNGQQQGPPDQKTDRIGQRYRLLSF